MIACCFFAGCDEGAADEDPPLADWEGTWQAVEPFFEDPATAPVYETIQELRPEYTLDEIEMLFLATADVDYATLEVQPDSLTFRDGSTVVCAGRYDVEDGTFMGDGSSDSHTYIDFDLVEATEGDCDSYVTVSITPLLKVDPEVHFHIVTSSASGALHPPPWNPSVWSTTTTPEFFAEGLAAQASNIASSLPDKP